MAWDPLGHFVVSQSNDRTCKVYSPRLAAVATAAGRGKGAAAAAQPTAPPPPTCASVTKDLVLQATLKKRGVPPDTSATAAARPVVAEAADAAPAGGGRGAGAPPGTQFMFHDEVGPVWAPWLDVTLPARPARCPHSCVFLNVRDLTSIGCGLTQPHIMLMLISLHLRLITGQTEGVLTLLVHVSLPQTIHWMYLGHQK